MAEEKETTFSVELLLSKYKTQLADFEKTEQNHTANLKQLHDQKQMINKQIEETVGQYNAAQGAKAVLSAQIADLEKPIEDKPDG